MSEIALVSSRKVRLEAAIKRGNKRAKKALRLAADPNNFLSTVQIGITLIGILTGVLSGDRLTGGLKDFFSSVPQLEPYAATLAVSCVVIVITFLSIVFGELLPKRIGLMYPEVVATAVAHPMTVVSFIARPFVWLLSKSNNAIFRLLGIEEKQKGPLSEEEIKAVIAESTRQGEIQQIEQELVKRVFSLGDRRVSELMTYRTDVVTLDIDDDFQAVRSKIIANPHAVYPVVRKNLDKVVGLVAVRDIFIKSLNSQSFKLAALIRKPVFVHENTAAYRVLEEFKKGALRLVMIVDEYGTVQGILSIADVVDSLIGESQEDSRNEYSITVRNENSWLIDAQLPYYEFVDYFNLYDAEEAGGFTTLAGLILHHLNHIPAEGEKLSWNDFEFEIVDMDGMRIDKVLITKVKNDASPDESDDV